MAVKNSQHYLTLKLKKYIKLFNVQRLLLVRNEQHQKGHTTSLLILMYKVTITVGRPKTLELQTDHECSKL